MRSILPEEVQVERVPFWLWMALLLALARISVEVLGFLLLIAGSILSNPAFRESVTVVLKVRIIFIVL
jgi:hypothetical protein